MEQIVEHRPTLGGVRTRVLELEGDGPPLLLIHGYADSADTWRLLLDRLRKQGRAAVALDLPGFGQAGHLREEPILPQFDRFLGAAIEHWSGEHGSVVLVGNSLGGTASLRAAERDEAGLISGVVPVAPAGLDMPLWFAAIQGAPAVRALLNSPVPVPEAAVRQAVGTAYRVLAFARPRKADGAVVGAFTSHFTDRRDVARILATGRSLLPELATPFRLERVGCPVLVVWGERDRMVFKTGASRIAREVAGARVELVPACGHCPQIEEPDLLAELLAGFPAQRDASGRDKRK
jgi:pimeloyl-ACP methyl ester carboxylesterase